VGVRTGHRNGRDEGFTKLIFSEDTHRLIGGRSSARRRRFISEIALAIEMGADAVDVGKTSIRIRRRANRWAWRQSSTKAVHRPSAGERR